MESRRDDRLVTCTLLRFGRVCPRVGSAWRASLQYPIAADPKIFEGQTVLCRKVQLRVSWEDPIVWASGDQAAVSLQLRALKRDRRALLLYQLGEPLALENFALLARKGALRSAPRGVRPGAEEGAGGGGSLEAWPKQTSFAEKKNPNQNTRRQSACPSSGPPPSSWAVHPSRVPPSGLKQGPITSRALETLSQ